MGKMILYSAVESTENYKINKKMFFQKVFCVDLERKYYMIALKEKWKIDVVFFAMDYVCMDGAKSFNCFSDLINRMFVHL